jgi:hypothetical protein
MRVSHPGNKMNTFCELRSASAATLKFHEPYFDRRNSKIPLTADRWTAYRRRVYRMHRHHLHHPVLQ